MNNIEEEEYNLANFFLLKDDNNCFLTEINKSIIIDKKVELFLNESIQRLFYIKSKDKDDFLRFLEDTKYFQIILNKSSKELFMKILYSVEKIVENPYFIGDTDILKTLLLSMLEKNIQENKEKIKIICENIILNKKDNICDKNKASYSFLYPRNMLELYNKYAPKAFNIMCFFGNNKVIMNNSYPTHHERVQNYKSLINIDYISELNLKNLKYPEIIFKKFGNNVLKDIFLSSNKKNKTKIINFLLDLLEGNISEQKELTILTLIQLDMVYFNKVIRRYPSVLKEISERDIKEKVNKYSIFVINHNNKKVIKKYNLNQDKELNILNSSNLAIENITKIILIEKILIEKKAIEKNLNTKEKLEKNIKKRI